LLGEDLRAAVIGAGVTGRVQPSTAAKSGPPADDGAAGDPGREDDTVLAPTAAQPAERLLTHPARPRKKKRR
jgi:preprotein translocase subunit SecF